MTADGLRTTIGMGLVLGLLSLAGCGGGGDGGVGGAGGGSSGTVVVDGSSTVFLISRAAQEGYNATSPDTQVIVNSSGTGGGFSKYMAGEVDIVDASRPAKSTEEAEAASKQLEWTRFNVGYDGITVVVHPSNSWAKTMTVAQLKALWEPGSTVKTWKDLDPSWPDRKINLYCPDTKSGTFEFFTEAINGKAKAQREDGQASADDNTLVTGVAGDPDAIGYFGYAYYAENKGKLQAVAVQNGPESKPVLPSPETVLDQSYKPLSRPLFIYVKKSAMARPEVGGFVRYYLQNVAELAKKGGYVPPTDAEIQANEAALGGQVVR